MGSELKLLGRFCAGGTGNKRIGSGRRSSSLDSKGIKINV